MTYAELHSAFDGIVTMTHCSLDVGNNASSPLFLFTSYFSCTTHTHTSCCAADIAIAEVFRQIQHRDLTFIDGHTPSQSRWETRHDMSREHYPFSFDLLIGILMIVTTLLSCLQLTSTSYLPCFYLTSTSSLPRPYLVSTSPVPRLYLASTSPLPSP